MYRGVADAFCTIYQREGVRGFFRGMPPTIQRGFIVNAAELSTYDHTKELLIASGLLNEGGLAHTSASCVAGLAGATASNPYVDRLLFFSSAVRGARWGEQRRRLTTVSLSLSFCLCVYLSVGRRSTAAVVVVDGAAGASAGLTSSRRGS